MNKYLIQEELWNFQGSFFMQKSIFFLVFIKKYKKIKNFYKKLALFLIFIRLHSVKQKNKQKKEDK